MDSFTFFRKHLAMSGIIEQRSPFNSRPFNLKNLAVITFASIYGISLAKLLNEAKTFDEYMDLVYKLSFVVIFTISYITIIWKSLELFGFVYRLEETMKESLYFDRVEALLQIFDNRLNAFSLSGSAMHPKIQSLYCVCSRQTEKWIKVLHFSCVRAAPPLCTVPPLMASFYAYLVTDLGGESFGFLFPMW